MISDLIRRTFREKRVDTEQGHVLVLFAGGLVAFLALVGMSVDVGRLVHLRTDLQKTADAAAFAGAQDLPDADVAHDPASSYVTQNRDGETLRNIQVFTTNEPNDTISVTAGATVDFIFLGVLGLVDQELTASATVRIEVVTGYSFEDYGVFPYAVWAGERVAQGGNGNGNGNGSNSAGISPVDANCVYGVCAGSTQLFRSNDWDADSEAAGSADWRPTTSANNFKGYFHHGGSIVQVSETLWSTFSNVGNAMGQEPTAELEAFARAGRPIIVPLVVEAQDGSGSAIEFKIVGWVALLLDTDFNASAGNHHWTGTVVAYHAASVGSTDGPTQPPTELRTWAITFVS